MLLVWTKKNNWNISENLYKNKNERYISESDNLGSTDSEVKKILTLHLPISEYDTLGSDSEGDGRATSQELMSFTHRMRGSPQTNPKTI